MEEIAERFMLSIGGHSNSYIDLVHNQLILDKLVEKQSISNTKPVDKQSISNTEPEVTVICVDNSFLLDDCGVHKSQAKAIALYSQEKIKAHPCNEVGLLAMGFIQGECFLKPTSDLKQIRSALKGLTYFGQSCIPIGQALTFFSQSDLPKRRLLVFFGGLLSLGSPDLESCAKRLKEFKVAVDVVNFGLQFLPPTKHKLLEAFVKAADNDGNSHYLYAPSGSTTSLGQQILCSSLAPGGLPMQEEKKKEQEVKKKEKTEKKLKKKMEQHLLTLAAPGGLERKREFSLPYL
ncbi:26S proteasome non-ATPase regulatory subunit 4 [Tanacetum coccineum]